MASTPKEPLKVVIEPTSSPASQPRTSKWQARFSIEGMTCSSCSGKVTEMLRALPFVRSADVNLIHHYAEVEYEASSRDHCEKKIIEAVEDMGFGCELDHLNENVEVTPVWEAVFSIAGMTCSSCTGKVQEALQGVPGVLEAEVNLMQGSAMVKFEGGRDAVTDNIINAVDDLGYDINLGEIRDITVEQNNETRTLQLRIGGFFCTECPKNVLRFLEQYDPPIKIERSYLSEEDRKNGSKKKNDPATVVISYTPQVPFHTVRTVIEDLEALNPAFEVSVYHEPSIEERAKIVRGKELKQLYIRLAVCFIIVIPSFLIGMVWMSFVPSHNKQRMYFEEPLWAGSVRRMDWALLILSTPVMFCIADVYHKRAISEVVALWRPGSRVPMGRRFYKFGSMNLLVSLGVSIAYFSSLALLIKAACTPYDMSHMNENGHVSSFFDSTIFLTFFLLIGRTMETWSKAKTASAVRGLTELRPSEVELVVDTVDTAESSSPDTPTGKEKNIFQETPPQMRTVKISVDLVEAGDVVVIPPEGIPVGDGKIVRGTTSFDEAALTGEAAPQFKKEGDEILAGTVNKGKAVHVKLQKVAGNSMLDQIVRVVREGSTKPAPMERIADVITGYFVPVVTLLAISTWIVWLSLGYTGAISKHWKPHDDTWAAWALEFAIAVFVIACPCGIGLAAPTALFVGTGLAAKYGILAKGGGEAFQEASGLDVVVFDKTGTLTMGHQPLVTDYELVIEGEQINGLDEQKILQVASKLEEVTAHPLGRAVVAFCEEKTTGTIQAVEVEEVPGRGLRGTFEDDEGRVQAIIGNEAFMVESGVAGWTQKYQNLLQKWKSEAKSVVLMASREVQGDGTAVPFELRAIFAVADPLRPEAAYVVKELQKTGHDVWMISGDNPTTAKAVARKVGIKEENVLAGVLPNEKADKIKYLQQTAPKRPRSKIARKLANALSSTPNAHRAIVAMVGDGINDAPALTNADVGIAIGSGSDVALGSAKFILVRSDLTALLTLTSLSKKVFNRVFFNFFWASIYNITMVPVAMGFFYPIAQARLSPVWASAAMAGSSLSVVLSSLLLKTKWPGVGFRTKVVTEAEMKKVVEEIEAEGRQQV
ncbi:heavy metal translocatin [Ascobolus immersus RN42]|uniref:Heavy metal translocatin n=1 Tax=Ascobolus immersus RN42 TaxID=1160509 RepID=A0A3N4HKR0_ASCIM|nr:heavy metal translocatin [Ascobolus immersus RN42]